MSCDINNITRLTEESICFFFNKIQIDFNFLRSDIDKYISKIEFSGAGYFVSINKNYAMYVYDYYKERTFNSINGFSAGGEPIIGSTIFMKDGFVNMVEFFCYENSWPEDFGNVVLKE